MRLWRLTAWPGLTGLGGMHVDGRWHRKGHPVVYAAEHPALAMIEAMVHLKLTPGDIPLTLKLFAIEARAGASISASPALPDGWQANESTTQVVGDRWLVSGQGLLLPIPSAVLPHATNYLINPAHPQAKTHLTEGAAEPFWFDKRLLR